MTEPVEPPAAVKQWTAADVRRARSLGRPDLIAQAHQSGQLEDLVKDPGDLAQAPSTTSSGLSAPMDLAAATALLAATEGEQS